MGSPLSPVIASIALERIEKAALEALSERDIIPVFYKRYVDDCLVCAKLNEQQSIMDMFNGMHQRLKFTIEQEVDGKIKFLDMIIRREEGGLTTEWFPKDENGRYLDFGSVSPFSHKVNTIVALVDRALKLTNVKYRERTLKTVKNILNINNYPEQLVAKIVKERTHKMYNSLSEEKIEQAKNFITIPYCAGLGEKLARYFKQYDINVAFKSLDKVKNTIFTKTKDKIPKEKTANVVYDIKCGECKKSYIGETSQFLHKRLEQHKNDVKNKKVGGSGLAQHSIEYGHIFDFKNTNILEKVSKYNTRICAEMFHIKIRGDSDVVNKQKDSINFKSAYNSILPKIKTLTDKCKHNIKSKQITTNSSVDDR
ncbi:uncharacterized protein LOC129749910 [Uranotaenia lowii]|uniref:uncharacterized protein LOC129749910 n=1 Tax=Uranotaenia lowii TaxID=190385 RepID=UPI002478D457|nr:uncharacterized protein LOC129749910 [Uranotaenia lowii]